MNMDAIYGATVAAKESRAGAVALTAASLQALPASVSPLDTAKALKHDQTQQSTNDPLMFGLLAAALVVWIWIEGRQRR